MFKFLKNAFGPEIVSGDAPRSDVQLSATTGNSDWDDAPAPLDSDSPAPSPVRAEVSDAAPAAPATSVSTSAPDAGAATATTAEAGNAAAPALDEVTGDDVLNVPLQETYAGNIKLLRKVQALPDRNDHKWKKNRDAKIYSISRKLHELANTTPAVVPAFRIQGAAHQKIMEMVRQECAAQIATLKEKDSAYHELRKHLTDEGLMPGEAKSQLEKLEAKIRNISDPAEIEKILARKNKLTAIASSYNIGMESVRQLNVKFLEMGDAVIALEKAIEKVLSAHEAELVKSETDFFASHGLRHQPTQVSDMVKTVRSRLAAVTGTYHNIVKIHEDRHPSIPVNWDRTTLAELFE